MNNQPPVPSWVPIKTKTPVFIPTADGKAVADTFNIEVPAWQDPDSGEIFLTNEAEEMIERAVRRRMGLLTPDKLKCLREKLGRTQAQISELLQIGEKTWSSWETGKQRQSRSMNNWLCALLDGVITPNYLEQILKQQSAPVQLDLPPMPPVKPQTTPQSVGSSGLVTRCSHSRTRPSLPALAGQNIPTLLHHPYFFSIFLP